MTYLSQDRHNFCHIVCDVPQGAIYGRQPQPPTPAAALLGHGLIAELQTLRALLQEEGARVQRNLAEYAHLSQSAMQSTKIIAESLAQWR